MNNPTRPAGPPSAADGPMQVARSPAGLADAVRDQANGYADRRRTAAAGFLSELTRALRSGAGELAEQAQVKPFVHVVADNLDVLSDRVTRRSWRELYRDAEAVARGNPLAAALVIGALGYGAFHVLRSGETDIRRAQTAEPEHAWGGNS